MNDQLIKDLLAAKEEKIVRNPKTNALQGLCIPFQDGVAVIEFDHNGLWLWADGHDGPLAKLDFYCRQTSYDDVSDERDGSVQLVTYESKNDDAFAALNFLPDGKILGYIDRPTKEIDITAKSGIWEFTYDPE